MKRSRYELVWLTQALMIVTCCAAFARRPKIVNSSENRIANEVLKNLLSSPLGKMMPRLNYQVALLAAAPANAFSNFQGKIYITEGLFPALYTDRGVWAAVIGHELGHVILHNPSYLPGFKERLRQDYLKARSEGFDQGPPQWPDIHLGQGISKLKFSREEEIQADFIGMMLMAEAGYQPSFVVILEQRLRYGMGDQAGILTMFSHHPRMETREEHTEKFYNIAMDIFRMRWPDAGKSPGGNLPPYGKLGPWTLQQAKGLLVFRVPFQVHNAAGMRVRIAAIFLDKNLRISTTDPRYLASDGSLALNSFIPGATDKSGRVILSVPAADLATHNRHLTAVVFLMAGERLLDISKLRTDLSPK